ncbi:MAG TPA: CocE/NonD family hydrolase [Candidatus Acidoferrales bacterium]|nr:CocE/NonD family hydrolase [Candidatus Acidoferrales bacterium]
MKRHTFAIAAGSILAGCYLLAMLFPSAREGGVSRAQEGSSQATSYSATFTKQDVMIPMRDGVKLHTEIYVPKNAPEALPFFLTRTPYGLNDDKEGDSQLLNLYRDMIPDDYIFVFQDIRGRYGSEGTFVMQRDPRDQSDSHSIDEGTDTYDTIDWLLKNVPNNNGRVGEAGISYGGWLTAMSLIEPHPALKAVSEQASPADMFLGDDFHHNGAFRLSYGFEYAAMMETGKTNFRFQFNRYDTYTWYLELGPLSNVDAVYLHGRLPTWENFVAHPNYDEFWKKQAFTRYFQNLTLKVPDLNVAGWWDQEDFYGPVRIFQLLKAHDRNHDDYLAVGPWNHGGWAHGAGSSLGNVDFGSDTAAYFRAKIQAPWFAYWLKSKGKLPLQRAETFQTGSDEWKQWNAWPPKQNVEERHLYFHSDGKLSFDPPDAGTSAATASSSGKEAFDSYVSDPANPVPYRHRPIEETYSQGSRWYWWLTEDQRFVEHRPDTLTWETEPLGSDITVAGDIAAHLFASTTGSDSDWIVKLIDVYPEKYTAKPSMGGYELMIADEVFRGRFHTSFEHPVPLVPNKITPFNIDLHTNDHTFLKGHRIMVQVQSTWFPIIDRNPQKYVPNIFLAKASDYQKATQRIFRSKQHPSNVEIPVVVN